MYQSDQPLIAFLGIDLEILFRNLLKCIHKENIIFSATDSAVLMQIDITNKESYKNVKVIDVGFVPSNYLSTVHNNDSHNYSSK